MKRLFLISLCVLFAAGTALADWDPGQPSKWVQNPDLTLTGLDVRAADPVVLADDFQCGESGPITDIHLWGSWLGDYLPNDPTGGNPDAANVSFTLSIHADIPAEPGVQEYSMPGETLWWTEVRATQVRPYAVDIEEGWYDPFEGVYIPSSQPADTVCWQYNFIISPRHAFEQVEGTIYWLDVQATPDDPNASFGWKTSLEHWTDDAVWAQGVEPGVTGWQELQYPVGHPLAGEPLDLAFVITPEPATIMLLGLGSLVFCRRRKK